MSTGAGVVQTGTRVDLEVCVPSHHPGPEVANEDAYVELIAHASLYGCKQSVPVGLYMVIPYFSRCSGKQPCCDASSKLGSCCGDER